jgi:hypothetical protein
MDILYLFNEKCVLFTPSLVKKSARMKWMTLMADSEEIAHCNGK